MDDMDIHASSGLRGGRTGLTTMRTSDGVASVRKPSRDRVSLLRFPQCHPRQRRRREQRPEAEWLQPYGSVSAGARPLAEEAAATVNMMFRGSYRAT